MSQEGHEEFEAGLWKIADNLRANSNLASNEYFMPIMGLLFLRQATNRYHAALEARIGTTITCSGPLFDPLRTHLDILGESAYPHLACLVVPIPAVLSSCRVRSIC